MLLHRYTVGQCRIVAQQRIQLSFPVALSGQRHRCSGVGRARKHEQRMASSRRAADVKPSWVGKWLEVRRLGASAASSGGHVGLRGRRERRERTGGLVRDEGAAARLLGLRGLIQVSTIQPSALLTVHCTRESGMRQSGNAERNLGLGSLLGLSRPAESFLSRRPTLCGALLHNPLHRLPGGDGGGSDKGVSAIGGQQAATVITTTRCFLRCSSSLL